MTAQIAIVGYEREAKCQHCGRPLKHGIRISDGRIVGATCLDKKLTKARWSHWNKKSYRLGAEQIIHIAKVVEFHAPANWSRYGVGPLSTQFEAVD